MMKKYFLLIVLFTLSFGLTKAQNVNDKVEIEWNGSWYPGKIIEVNEEEGSFLVSYDG